MTPAFREYVFDLINLAARDYGLNAGSGVTYKDYNNLYEDGKTRNEYWDEVVSERLLKVEELFEEAWDHGTKTLNDSTDFSRYLIRRGRLPKVWYSGTRQGKNSAALSEANMKLSEKTAIRRALVQPKRMMKRGIGTKRGPKGPRDTSIARRTMCKQLKREKVTGRKACERLKELKIPLASETLRILYGKYGWAKWFDQDRKAFYKQWSADLNRPAL